MNDYVGKICPVCKQEINELDKVTVCPDCGMPHHTDCWEMNGGCSTFGCAQQGTVEVKKPMATCSKCGAELADGQEFCPKCGTPRGGVKKNVCGKCGAELQDGQEFCPKCGQKVGLAVDSNVSSAINQFNAGVDKKKKKAKVLPIILAIIAVIAIAAVVIGGKISGAKKAEAAKDEYLANAKTFKSKIYTAGSNLEDIADTIQKYWYENIWEDKHGSDIDEAILYAMIDKSDEIDKAEKYDSELATLYSKLKRVPDNISEEDKEEIKEICDAVKDLYNVYSEFYDLATDPSGNYNSYSDNNNDTTNEFIKYYKKLDNLLD